MTPAQRALILHALGLTPRDGVMPRWSYRNHYVAAHAGNLAWRDMIREKWAVPSKSCVDLDAAQITYHVTRLGAEAAGVLGRCRWEDLEHG